MQARGRGYLVGVSLGCLVCCGILAGCWGGGETSRIEVALTVEPEGAGTIQLDPPGGVYFRGTEVTFTAVPAGRFAFAEWDVPSYTSPMTRRPLTLRLDYDTRIGARFTDDSLRALTVTIDPPDSGAVTAEPPGDSHAYGTYVDLTAEAAPGYVFVHWSNDTYGYEQRYQPFWVAMTGDQNVTARFAEDRFFPVHVEIDPPEGGSAGTSPEGGSYYPRTLLNFYAAAAEGYGFVGWSGDVSGYYERAIHYVDGETWVTAHFAPLVPLTVEIDPPYGGAVELTPPGGMYTPGDWVRMRPGPEPDYEFTGWTGDVETETGAITVIVSSATSVTAHFAIPDPVTLDVALDPPGGGTVQLQPPGGAYAVGTTVTLVAEPAPGYVFAGWTGDVSGDANRTAVTMDSDKAVQPHFAAAPGGQYTLTLHCPDWRNGDVALDPPGGAYEPGTAVTLTPVPETGYALFHWRDNDSGDQVTDNPLIITMDGDRSFDVEFAYHYRVLSVSTYRSGSVLLDPPGGAYEPGTSVTMTAVPGEGYRFSYFDEVQNGRHTHILDNPVVVTMDADKSFIAYFDSEYPPSEYGLGVTVCPPDAGEVLLAPPGGLYAPGTRVRLTAVPNPGYAFDRWSDYWSCYPVAWGDGIYGPNNPFRVVMNKHRGTVAVFRGTEHYTIETEVVPPESGTLSFDPPPLEGGYYFWDERVKVTPEPAEGYVFAGWEGDVTGIGRPAELLMERDRSLTAEFRPVERGEFTLTVVVDIGYSRMYRGRPDWTSETVSVTADPSGGSYAPGTTVVLTVETAGYTATWSSLSGGRDALYSSPPLAIVMDGDKTLTLTLTDDWYDPICQAHKLLDEDPVVRVMAEELLLTMGEREFGYMSWAAREAEPALAARIREVMDAVRAGARPDPARWPSAAECIERLDHADSVVAIMSAQMLGAIQAKESAKLDAALKDRVGQLLAEGKARSLAGPWRRPRE